MRWPVALSIGMLSLALQARSAALAATTFDAGLVLGTDPFATWDEVGLGLKAGVSIPVMPRLDAGLRGVLIFQGNTCIDRIRGPSGCFTALQVAAAGTLTAWAVVPKAQGGLLGLRLGAGAMNVPDVTAVGAWGLDAALLAGWRFEGAWDVLARAGTTWLQRMDETDASYAVQRPYGALGAGCRLGAVRLSAELELIWQGCRSCRVTHDLQRIPIRSHACHT
jgi:hypothetical protein